ncbi:MAG: glycosyltransferase, partial [Armatimonadota bacterium]
MAARRNTKIKVAHVLDHVGLGGIQTQLYRVLSHLDRDRFEVHLHTPRGARAMKDDFEALDLTFYHYSKSFFGLPWIMAEFARHVREEEYDIMHYHMAASRVFGYLSLRSKPDSTHIVVHHHSHLFRLPTYYGIVPKFDSMADMLLACSSAVADEVRSAYD